jgi:hypothetical protein
VPVTSCSYTHETPATAFVTFRRLRHLILQPARRTARKNRIIKKCKVYLVPQTDTGPNRESAPGLRPDAKSKSTKVQHRPSPTNGHPNHRMSPRPRTDGLTLAPRMSYSCAHFNQFCDPHGAAHEKQTDTRPARSVAGLLRPRHTIQPLASRAEALLPRRLRPQAPSARKPVLEKTTVWA